MKSSESELILHSMGNAQMWGAVARGSPAATSAGTWKDLQDQVQLLTWPTESHH